MGFGVHVDPFLTIYSLMGPQGVKTPLMIGLKPPPGGMRPPPAVPTFISFTQLAETLVLTPLVFDAATKDPPKTKTPPKTPPKATKERTRRDGHRRARTRTFVKHTGPAALSRVDASRPSVLFFNSGKRVKRFTAEPLEFGSRAASAATPLTHRLATRKPPTVVIDPRRHKTKSHPHKSKKRIHFETPTKLAVDDDPELERHPVWGKRRRTLTKPGAAASESMKSLLDEETRAVANAYKVLNHMLWLLDEVPRRCQMSRGEAQKEFHRAFLGADAENLFGKYLASQAAFIKEEYNIETGKRLSMVAAPRRCGKTIATVFYIIAALIACKSDTSAVFSPGARQSGWFCKEVRKKLMKPEVLDLFGDTAPTINAKAENLSVLNSIEDQREVHFMPANENGTRGITTKRVILEEAAAMDPRVVGNVTAPLLMIKGTALMGISSVQGEDNFYSKFLEATNVHGIPLFNIVHLKLVCDEHLRQGCVADACPCNEHMKPAWFSSDGIANAASLLESMGMKENAEAELFGRVVASQSKQFPAPLVSAFINRIAFNPKVESSRPSYAFLVTDPNGGGKSEFATALAYVSSGRFVVRFLSFVFYRLYFPPPHYTTLTVATRNGGNGISFNANWVINMTNASTDGNIRSVVSSSLRHAPPFDSPITPARSRTTPIGRHVTKNPSVSTFERLCAINMSAMKLRSRMPGTPPVVDIR